MTDTITTPRPDPALWQPLLEQFESCCPGPERKPFLCLIRFERPGQPEFDLGERFAAQRGDAVCWPCVFHAYSEGGGPSHERVQLGAAADGSLLEMACVYDCAVDGRGIRRYHALAARAAALLPAGALSRVDLISRRGVCCTGRPPFREADRWTWYVFRSLHGASLLRSQSLPEARAEAFWFAGDACAASAAAMRLAATAEPAAAPKPAKKTGRPLDPTKSKVVEFIRGLREKNMLWKNIPDAVYEEFGVRYERDTLRKYLRVG